MALFDKLLRRGDDDGENRSLLGTWVKQSLAELNANIREDRPSFGEDAGVITGLYKSLETRFKGLPYTYGSRSEEPRNMEIFSVLSEDRLRGYVCIFPTMNGGADLTPDEAVARLRYEGLTTGIKTERLEKALSEGEYLRVFLAAEGTPPVEGQDGSIEELFPRLADFALDVKGDGLVDFRDRDFARTVSAGTVICRLKLPVPGCDGVDVTGRAIPCRSVAAVTPPMGENTRLDANGTTLTAAVDGLLYCRDDLFCVRKQRVITVDLTVALNVTGDLVVTGNVCGGARVEATGDIIVAGELRDAELTSTGGTIRVVGGVKGVQGRTRVSAVKQFQSPSIENAEIKTGGNIYSEVIFDSDLVCGGMVNVLAAPGIIVGGNIQALKRVACQKIGNLSGKLTRVTIGCEPSLIEEWKQNRRELDEAQSVMDKLWENISGLRKLGSRISDEQKEVMNKLVEQRNLYEAKRNTLRTERDSLRAQMKAASSGRLVCAELNPVVELQIGEHRAEYKRAETKCSIHVQDNDLVLR